MILKSYDLNKLDINKNNIVLFYGQNQGAKEEEIDKIIHKNKLVVNKYDEKQVEESSCLIVIQINGKKRGLINTNLNLTEKEIMELIYKDEKISKYY